jgi:pimeloyl-ACP methyl ester carboxylesterase
VIAPDLRGHGESPGGENYSLAALAADVRALGGRWDLVVGHSLGGTLAAQLLHDDPDFAGRAVLLDPVLVLSDDDASFEAIVAEQLAELATPSGEPHWHPEDVRRKVLAARATSPAVNEAVLRDNRPWDYAHLLDGVTTPVLILGSDPGHGGMLDPALGETLGRRPMITYRRLDGVGHSAHRDDPARVIEAL